MLKALFISGLFVSIGVILGRIAGFVREIILASTFGISSSADMAVLILTIPDLLSSLLIGGAMSAALVPFFRVQDARHGLQLWWQLNIWIGLFFIIFSAFTAWGVSNLIKIFAPGMAYGLVHALSGFLQISLCSIPLTALSGLNGAYLQAKDHFFLTASGSLIINFVLITGLLFFGHSQNALLVLSLAVLLGSLLRYLVQSLAIVSLPQPLAWAVAANSPTFVSKLDRRVLLRYFEAMAGGSMLMLLPFIARSFASFQGVGAIASFNYAIKLIDLPYATGLASFGVVLLPKLSDLLQNSQNKGQAFVLTQDALLLISILSLSFSLVLFFFSDTLVNIVYGWGRITSENLLTISILFKWGIWGLPALGFNTLLTAVFNARENTRTPFLIYLLSFLLFLPFAFLGQKVGSLLGIIWAMTATYYFIAFLQFYFLYKYYNLNLWRVIVSMDFIKIVLAQIGILSPAIYLASNINGSVWLMLALALITGMLLLLAGVLAVRKYRKFIVSHCHSRPAINVG